MYDQISKAMFVWQDDEDIQDVADWVARELPRNGQLTVIRRGNVLKIKAQKRYAMNGAVFSHFEGPNGDTASRTEMRRALTLNLRQLEHGVGF